jgi:hypothetical protein
MYHYQSRPEGKRLREEREREGKSEWERECGRKGVREGKGVEDMTEEDTGLRKQAAINTQSTKPLHTDFTPVKSIGYAAKTVLFFVVSRGSPSLSFSFTHSVGTPPPSTRVGTRNGHFRGRTRRVQSIL